MDFDRRISKLRSRLQEFPDDPENWVELALALGESGDHASAAFAFTKASELAPDSTVLRLRLLTSLRNAEQYEEAVALADKILAEHECPDATYIKAWSLRELGELEKALDLFLSGINDYGDGRNFTGAGTAHARMGNYEDALRCYEKAIEVEPANLSDSEFLYTVAIAKIETNNPTEAIQLLSQALTLDPEHREAGNELGKLLAYEGKYDAAIQTFLRVLDHYPSDSVTLNNIGHAYLYAGMPQKSLTYFDEAIETAPDYVNSRFGRGSARISIHDFAGAVEDFKTCIELMPEEESGWINLARCQLELSDTEAAEATIQKGLELHNDAQKLRSLLKYI